MVILSHDMPALNVGMEFLQTEAYPQTLSLIVCIGSLNVSKSFTGKCYGLTILYLGGP